MNKFILREIPESVVARKNEARRQYFTMIRISLISLVLVFSVKLLMLYWGSPMSPIQFYLGISLAPLMGLSLIVPLYFQKQKLTFTRRYLLVQTCHTLMPIFWSSIKTATLEPIVQDKSYYEITFNMSFNRKRTFRLHRSHNQQQVTSLLHEFGKVTVKDVLD